MIVETLLAVALVHPARVQVTADEYRLTLSRLRVKSGPAIVQLVNFGEDAHDLLLRRKVKGSRTHRIAKIRPGRVAELELRLFPGRYAVWCSVGKHASHGMRATLTVTR